MYCVTRHEVKRSGLAWAQTTHRPADPGQGAVASEDDEYVEDSRARRASREGNAQWLKDLSRRNAARFGHRSQGGLSGRERPIGDAGERVVRRLESLARRVFVLPLLGDGLLVVRYRLPEVRAGLMNDVVDGTSANLEQLDQ